MNADAPIFARRGRHMDALTLTGMPGAGKSTVGPILAAMLGLAHLDTDSYLEACLGATLQDIMDQAGLEGFKEVESSVLMDLSVVACVLSTGGSVIYSKTLMDKLHALGPVVFLDVSLEVVRARIGPAEQRGLVLASNQNLDSLYRERRPLYQAEANLTIAADGLNPRECAEAIAARLAESGLWLRQEPS